jgi:hypothetical protein
LFWVGITNCQTAKLKRLFFSRKVQKNLPLLVLLLLRGASGNLQTHFLRLGNPLFLDLDTLVLKP